MAQLEIQKISPNTYKFVGTGCTPNSTVFTYYKFKDISSAWNYTGQWLTDQKGRFESWEFYINTIAIKMPNSEEWAVLLFRLQDGETFTDPIELDLNLKAPEFDSIFVIYAAIALAAILGITIFFKVYKK